MFLTGGAGLTPSRNMFPVSHAVGEEEDDEKKKHCDSPSVDQCREGRKARGPVLADAERMEVAAAADHLSVPRHEDR